MKNNKIVIGIVVLSTLVFVYLVFDSYILKSKYVVIEAKDAHHIDNDIYTNEGVTGENIYFDKFGNRINSVSKLTKEHSKDGFIINDLYSFVLSNMRTAALTYQND